MKCSPWIVPVTVAVVVVIWTGRQQRVEEELQVVIRRLKEAIRQVDVQGVGSEGGKGARAAAQDKRNRLRTLAGAMRTGHGGMPDLRLVLRLQRMVQDLTPEELLVQLDEVDSLQLGRSERDMFVSCLIGALAEKDPQLALERFVDRIGKLDGMSAWHLSTAFQTWLDKDATLAAGWFDQQIRDGRFESTALDGTNQSRVRFETPLVKHLLKTDIEGAIARMADLSPHAREAVLQEGYSFGKMQASEDAGYARLLRSTLAADKASEILANTAAAMSEKGKYDRVDTYLKNVQPGAGETDIIIRRVMENQLLDRAQKPDLTRESVDAVRGWAAGHAPDSVDAATGTVLGDSLMRGASYEQTRDLVLEYQQQGGGDAVLAAFLRVSGPGNKSNRELIDRIQDAALREEIRKLPQFQ